MNDVCETMTVSHLGSGLGGVVNMSAECDVVRKRLEVDALG